MKLHSMLSVLALSLSLGLAPSLHAEDFTKAQIEQIIHDYLINNPDVMIEVGEKIKNRQVELEKQEQAKVVASIINNPNIPQSGAENAKHTIIEFFDYNCGYCKKAKPITMKLLEKQKDVRYYYLEFPILSEVSAVAAKVGVAIYSLDPQKYVAYNNDLMTRPQRLNNEVEVQALVEKLGLNWKEVKQIADSAAVKDVLLDIRDAAEKMNVTGTPSFIIDGTPLHGAPTSEDLITNYFKK